MKIFNELKYEILYGGLDAIAISRVEAMVTKSNRRAVLRFSVIAMVMFAIMFAGSLSVASLRKYMPVYLAGLCLVAVIWWIAKYPAAKSERLVKIDMYAFIFVVLCLGVVMGTVLAPNELATTYIALLIAVPSIFVDRPWKIHIPVVASVIVFIVMTLLYKSPATKGPDIINALVFGILSIALTTYAISNRLKRYELEASIRFLAENDPLTGLKNRFSYERYIGKIRDDELPSIYCIYIDANGLHTLNNTQGHAAGDALICTIANAMTQFFGDEDTYRIGGDEFVVIGKEKSFDELPGLIAQMKQVIEEKDYHASAGMGRREKPEDDIMEIIKIAEREMYADKDRYYVESGIDRRR